MTYIVTAKNSIIAITSTLLPTPLVLQGFSSENILAIPDVDIIKSTIGLDGQLARSVTAKQIEGSFSFFAGSPSLTAFYQIQQAVYISGIPFVGTMSVTLLGLAQGFTFPEFTIISAPKGFELADEVKPVTIKWSCLMPNYASLGAIAAPILGALF
jgi:hypothetical protein